MIQTSLVDLAKLNKVIIRRVVLDDFFNYDLLFNQWDRRISIVRLDAFDVIIANPDMYITPRSCRLVRSD